MVCDSGGHSFIVGLYVGFFVAPTDSQQGEAYRIIFIHVPAAWMGMLLYVLMAIYAGIGWAFNARLSSMMASSIAITGAMFTVHLAGNRRFLGQTDLGHVVGLGCADDFNADFAFSLHRLHLFAVFD